MACFGRFKSTTQHERHLRPRGCTAPSASPAGMARLRWVGCLLLASLARPARADDPAAGEPPRFDVSINGENFIVEGGRLTRLKSTAHPGTEYRIAVQLAQMQHWKLNSLQFDYQSGFEVTDDGKPVSRTATLRHSLGFVVAITDFGGPLPTKSTADALKLLVDSVQKSLADSGAKDLKVGKTQRSKLGSNTVDSVALRYLGADGAGRSSTVYLVTAEKFACSCLLQCQDEDRKEAVDLVKSSLESMAAWGARN
jgi:hypothetical protein